MAKFNHNENCENAKEPDPAFWVRCSCRAELCRATREGDIPDGSDVLFTLRMLEKLTANGKGEIADDAGCMWGIDQIAGQAIAIIRWAHSRTLSRVAVQEGMEKDAESWKLCTGEHDLGNGEVAKMHVIVGVNVWRGEEWRGFHQCTPDEAREVIDSIAAAQRQEGGSNG